MFVFEKFLKFNKLLVFGARVPSIDHHEGNILAIEIVSQNRLNTTKNHDFDKNYGKVLGTGKSYPMRLEDLKSA